MAVEAACRSSCRRRQPLCVFLLSRGFQHPKLTSTYKPNTIQFTKFKPSMFYLYRPARSICQSQVSTNDPINLARPPQQQQQQRQHTFYSTLTAVSIQRWVPRFQAYILTVIGYGGATFCYNHCDSFRYSC